MATVQRYSCRLRMKMDLNPLVKLAGRCHDHVKSLSKACYAWYTQPIILGRAVRPSKLWCVLDGVVLAHPAEIP